MDSARIATSRSSTDSALAGAACSVAAVSSVANVQMSFFNLFSLCYLKYLTWNRKAMNWIAARLLVRIPCPPRCCDIRINCVCDGRFHKLWDSTGRRLLACAETISRLSSRNSPYVVTRRKSLTMAEDNSVTTRSKMEGGA